MFSKFKLSLKSINYKLYASLLLLGFVPTIYTTLRVFFIGKLPSEWAFFIAGQLSWVNLLYEILNVAIILPLFFFIGICTSFEKRKRGEFHLAFAMYKTAKKPGPCLSGSVLTPFSHCATKPSVC